MRQVSSRRYFPRPSSKLARRILAKYVGWIEKGTFAFTFVMFVGIGYSFIRHTDDTISAGGLEVKADETPVTVGVPSIVVKLLKQPFDRVAVGDPLAVVTSDPSAFPDLLAMAAISRGDSGIDAVAAAPFIKRLQDEIKNLKTTTMLSPKAGIFVVSPDSGMRVLKIGDAVATINDPTRLSVEGSFEGETAAYARVGQVARLTSLDGPSGSVSTVVDFVRQGSKESMPADLDDQIRQPLKAELSGKPISFLDDIPFTIDDVKDVQIALSAQAVPDVDRSPRLLDQPVGAEVLGRVVTGRHEAVIQVSGLSAQSLDQITNDARESLVSRSFKISNGEVRDYQPIKVVAIGQPTVVVTVKASAEAGNTSTKTLKGMASHLPQGSKVKRSFKARIDLDSPQYLQDLYVDCLKAGKPLKANAEIVTGERALALQLLKR
jgi:hypothetical protein